MFCQLSKMCRNEYISCPYGEIKGVYYIFAARGRDSCTPISHPRKFLDTQTFEYKSSGIKRTPPELKQLCCRGVITTVSKVGDRNQSGIFLPATRKIIMSVC